MTTKADSDSDTEQEFDLFDDNGIDSTGFSAWVGARVLRRWLVAGMGLAPAAAAAAAMPGVEGFSGECTGPIDCKGLAVCELGCGKAMPGFASSKLGAAVAVLTDGNQHCVDRLRDELIPQWTAGRGGGDDRRTVGDGDDDANDVRAAAATTPQPRIHAQLLKWGVAEQVIAVRALAPSGGFDMVLAAEVLYGDWKVNLELMLESVATLLSAKKGAQLVLSSARVGVSHVPDVPAQVLVLAPPPPTPHTYTRTPQRN
jgi:predicted nicotinamide N-methyase